MGSRSSWTSRLPDGWSYYVCVHIILFIRVKVPRERSARMKNSTCVQHYNCSQSTLCALKSLIFLYLQIYVAICTQWFALWPIADIFYSIDQWQHALVKFLHSPRRRNFSLKFMALGKWKALGQSDFYFDNKYYRCLLWLFPSQTGFICSPAQSMNWREGGNYSAPGAHAFNYTRRQAVCTFEKTHAAHWVCSMKVLHLAYALY